MKQNEPNFIALRLENNNTAQYEPIHENDLLKAMEIAGNKMEGAFAVKLLLKTNNASYAGTIYHDILTNRGNGWHTSNSTFDERSWDCEYLWLDDSEYFISNFDRASIPEGRWADDGLGDNG